MLDLIARISREQQMTVILSSHQLNHIQRICNRVGMLVKGKMVVEGLLEQLGREAFGGGHFSIEVQLTEITSGIIDSLKKIKGVVNVKRSGDLLQVGCQKDLRPQIAKSIVDSGGSLVEMKIQSYALEDIYMKYFTEA
jgi:ABC-2 type transport system ATP-binding protein